MRGGGAPRMRGGRMPERMLKFELADRAVVAAQISAVDLGDLSLSGARARGRRRPLMYIGEQVANGAGAASGGLARGSRRLEPFACAYAFTASRKWLVGMLTLVSSLARHNEPTDACVYRVLWHPSISDTVLTAAERGMLTETARTARVEWVQVDSRRYAT